MFGQPVFAASDENSTDEAAWVVAQVRDTASTGDMKRCAARITEGDVTSGGLVGRFTIATDPATQTGIIETTDLGPLNFSVGVTQAGVWVRDGNATVRDADFPGFRAGLVSDIYWASGGLGNACWPAATQYVGEEMLGEDATDILEVVPQGGKATKVWISRKSHLPVKWTRRDEPATATTSYTAYGSGAHRAVPSTQIFVDRDGTQWALHTSRLRSVVTSRDIAALAAKPATRLKDYGIDSATSTTVQMRMDGQPFIDVYIDGKGPFNFMVDSGATLTISSTLIPALGLKSAGEGSDTDMSGAVEAVHYVRVPDLRIGAAHLHGMYGSQADFGELFKVGQRSFDGIVGSELLERFVTTFDYPHRTLTLALSPSISAADYARFGIPFALDHTFPVTGGQINGIPAQFTVDTGSNRALMLFGAFAARHAAHMPTRKYSAGSGYGASGKPAPIMYGRIASLNIGEAVTSNFVAIFPEASIGLASDAELAGNLGDEAFVASALTFDYRDHKAWVVPEPSAAPHQEKYNQGGMKLKIDAAHNAVVSLVLEDSPAWDAGIRENDQVTAIDGNAVSQDLVNVTNTKMSSGELKSVRLSVIRGKTRVELTVQPRDYIQ